MFAFDSQSHRYGAQTGLDDIATLVRGERVFWLVPVRPNMEYVAQTTFARDEPIATAQRKIVLSTLETQIELRSLWLAESETLAFRHQSRASMAIKVLRFERNRTSEHFKSPPTHVELRSNTNVYSCIYYLNTQLHTAVRQRKNMSLYGFCMVFSS